MQPIVYIVLLALCSIAVAQVLMGGYNLNDDRRSNDIYINKQTVSSLTQKWAFQAYGQITVTPAIVSVNGVMTAFFPDWAGWFYAVNFETGGLIWAKQLKTYINAKTNSFSRSSPAYDPASGLLIIGDQIGARLYGVRATDGTCVWSTLINSHLMAQISQSATIYNGYAYIGANSGEEGWFAVQGYPCCSFQGSFSKIQMSTGQITWTFYTVPADNSPNGYAGGGVWGSHPAIDVARNMVYIGTGNNYRVPDSVSTCMNANTANPNICQAANNYAASMVALRMDDGSVAWAYRVGTDVWTAAITADWSLHKDWDFAQGAILFQVTKNNVTQDVVGQGNKGGTFYTLNRDTGAVVWSSWVGPGNSGGGLMWGSAADDTQIYAANANAGAELFWATGGVQCYNGFYMAINKNTGSITWSKCNPAKSQTRTPMTVVNGGVVFGGSMDNVGTVYAMDTTNGNILWSFASGASNVGGMAITNGVILFSSGYNRWGQGTFGKTMYAFEVPTRYQSQDNTAAPIATSPPATLPPTIPPTTTAAPTYPPDSVLVTPATNSNGDYVYTPTALAINLGQTVTFTQIDIHPVYQTPDAVSQVPVTNGTASGAGTYFSVTFTSALVAANSQYGGNVFYFRCRRHGTMLVAITVNGGGFTPTPITTQAPQPTQGPIGAYGGNCTAAGYPSSKFGMRYFVDPLPIPSIAVPVSSSSAGAIYNINITDFQTKIHTDLAPIWVRGYNGMYPGPTIIAQKNVPVTVNWQNQLSSTSTVVNVDTIPAGLTTTRIVTHLHGGDNIVSSDGSPEQAVDVGGTYQAIYSNAQNPMPLWYHDHAMGITRANVYMGLAALYWLRSSTESILNLPTGDLEIPLVIQDKTIALDTNGNPYQYYPQHWQKEMFGDVILVNGKVWPYLTVQPKVYRLRILNASNSRFYQLKWSNTTQTFTTIGADQGYIKTPVVMQAIVLAPGERVDVLVNFCAFAGQNLILQNNANAPYPSGTNPFSATVGIDPCLQGRIMQFRVAAPAPTKCPSMPTMNLSSYTDKSPAINITANQSVFTRDLVLKQDASVGMPMLGVRWPNGTIITYMYEDPATEYVKAGSVELWRIWNLTPDSHPMHIHSSALMIQTRQTFDQTKFLTGTIALTGSAKVPAAFEAGPKDMFVANPGTVTNVLVKFTTNVGRHLWHCHILEHEDNMMMRPLIVSN